MENQQTTRVLVIDDDPGGQMLAKLVLAKSSRAGYEVTVADSLGVAEGFLRRQTFDVILLDLGLPECRGLNTLDHVRGFAEQTPIVVRQGLPLLVRPRGLQAIRAVGAAPRRSRDKFY